MGDHDDGVAVLLVDGLYELQYLLAGLVIQRAGGLIAKQDVRILNDGTANGGALLLAAGKLVGQFSAVIPQAQQVEQLIHIQRAAGEVSAHLDVFPHGQVRDEVVHLEDVAQMAAAVEGQGLLVHIGHTLAVDKNVAGVGAVDAAQDVEQRGLAGAGRPQQHAEFAFFHGQVDAFQHLDPVFTAAKGLFDLIQFKKHRNAPLLVS